MEKKECEIKTDTSCENKKLSSNGRICAEHCINPDIESSEGKCVIGCSSEKKDCKPCNENELLFTF